MATAMKAVSKANKNTVMVCIVMQTETPTLEIGRMMNKTVMGFIPLQMDLAIRAIFKQECSRVRGNWSTKPEKRMILLSTSDIGRTANRMAREKLTIEMEIIIRVPLNEGCVQGSASSSSTKPSNIKASGEIPCSTVMGNYTAMGNAFSKASSKTG